MINSGLVLFWKLSIAASFIFFFLNDPATPKISPLPLHDALPIYPASRKNLYRNFDFNHNQFSLNYAEIAVEQKPGVSNSAGFRADIGFGDAATWIHATEPADRKSTRLNSSHLVISYAVFCLKKKK